jgi:hypothetical protein
MSRSDLRCPRLLDVVAMISVFASAVFILSYGFGVASPAAEFESTELSASTTQPLEVFEVQAPLRKSYEDTSCQQVIVQHDFASSYGTPYVGGQISSHSPVPRTLIKDRNILPAKRLRVHHDHLQPLSHLSWHQLRPTWPLILW